MLDGSGRRAGRGKFEVFISEIQVLTMFSFYDY